MKPSARRISYAAIAAAFAINKPTRYVRPSAFEQWKDDVMSIADVLQASSPKFNRKRFLIAAGLGLSAPLTSSAASQHYIDTGRRPQGDALPYLGRSL